MATNSSTYLGGGTFLPSNFVTPQGPWDVNPNWTQTPSAQPEVTNIVEDAHDRLMVVVGYPIEAIHTGGNADKSEQNELFQQEAQRNEQTAKFQFTNLSLSQCTGIYLEQAILTVPPHQNGKNRSMNLTNTLCGDFIDDDMDAPRRWVFSEFSPNVGLIIKNVNYSFSLTNFLPNGSAIGYYSLSDVITYLLNAWQSFMNNTIGDSSFVASMIVDRYGPKVFFTSTMFSKNQVRLDVRLFVDTFPNAMNLLSRHVWFSSPFPDTNQTGTSGESFYIRPRANTHFQNNANFLTFHSNELTQFRRQDSIAPTEGNSLIAVGTPGATDDSTDVYVFRQKTLVSPKIFFDKFQTLNSFEVSVRAASESGTYGALLKYSPTELQNISLTLIFRLW